MGILDDAIREHLDLKRRRGADPAEVERAEREALGPVRRNPSPDDLPAVEDDETDGGFAYDQAGDEDWSHDSLPEPVADAGVEPAYDEPAYDEPPLDAGPPPEFPPAPDPVPPPASSEPVGHAGPDTAQYDVEDALAAEDEHATAANDPRAPAGDDDDVLEETPEFLQDTPDHDRLWFEQRPPKDFDFDE
jgi:hypothetical protein